MTDDSMMTKTKPAIETCAEDLALLDQFACMAMQRINAGNMITRPDAVATEAYSYALAAMRERKKAYATFMQNLEDYTL